MTCHITHDKIKSRIYTYMDENQLKIPEGNFNNDYTKPSRGTIR